MFSVVKIKSGFCKMALAVIFTDYVNSHEYIDDNGTRYRFGK
jgi:hypothetical protein